MAVVILHAYKISNWLLVKSGGLHEKHVVATWNFGNRLSIYSDSYWQHDYLQAVQTKTTQFYNILDRVSLCEPTWTHTRRAQFSLLLLHHTSEAQLSPMVLHPTVWAPDDRCIWIIGIIISSRGEGWSIHRETCYSGRRKTHMAYQRSEHAFTVRSQ